MAGTGMQMKGGIASFACSNSPYPIDAGSLVRTLTAGSRILLTLRAITFQPEIRSSHHSLTWGDG